MKQQITPEQRAELSSKARERLIDWCFDHTPRQRLANLNIGQMIEFLDEQRPNRMEISRDDMKRWILWYPYFDDSKEDYFYLAHELCDALWKAVKEILEQDA